MSETAHPGAVELIYNAFKQHGPYGPNPLRDMAEHAARVVSHWQPIETAPRDGTRFLAVAKSGCMHVDRRHPTKQTERAKCFWEEYPRDPYTHWMPLPDGPR